MADNGRTEQLLNEILQTERAHLEEYKRVTAESLRLQRQAVEAQGRYIHLLRPALIVGAVIVAGLIVYVLWLSRFVR